jgi:transposase
VIHVRLPPTTAARLDTLFRATDEPKLRHRLQIVLMAHRGRPRQAIAADLGVNRKTVTRWINASCDGGLDALRPKKAKGTPGHIPGTLADEVTRWVIDDPPACGLDRANWTHEELADHLLKTHGTRTSRAPSSGSARGSASAWTAPPTATTGATRSSRPRPRRTWPAWEKSGGR